MNTNLPPTSTVEQPFVEGWFEERDGLLYLLGQHCSMCGSYFFPPTRFCCGNPDCTSDNLAAVTLSRNGKLWSYTTNHYPAPAPYIAAEPFKPYIVAAVELAKECMIVLGPMVPGSDESQLSRGTEVSLAAVILSETDETRRIGWGWQRC